MKKQRWEESERGREEERRSEKINTQKEEDAASRKGRKAQSTVFFPMFCGCGGSKSRFAKVAGAIEKLDAVVVRSTSPSKHVQHTTKHTILGPLWEFETSKVRRVVARSTCRSQKVQSTACLEHFWKLRYSKVHGVVA